MKMLITAFPVKDVNVKIISDLNNIKKPIREGTVWYVDFIPMCQIFAEKYDIDEIYLCGSPQSYIAGFLEQLEASFDIPVSVINS